MSSNSPLPPPPDGDYLKWITQNPDEFGAYLKRLYALGNLQIVVTVNGVSTKYPVLFSEGNATISITIQ